MADGRAEVYETPEEHTPWAHDLTHKAELPNEGLQLSFRACTSVIPVCQESHRVLVFVGRDFDCHVIRVNSNAQEYHVGVWSLDLFGGQGNSQVMERGNDGIQLFTGTGHDLPQHPKEIIRVVDYIRDTVVMLNNPSH